MLMRAIYIASIALILEGFLFSPASAVAAEAVPPAVAPAHPALPTGLIPALAPQKLPPPPEAPAAEDPSAAEPEPAPAASESVPESPPEPVIRAPVPVMPAGPLPGPGNELDLFKLDEILNSTVVTAGHGKEEERALATASVFTISSEEIQAHGWRSLAEALANVPGLYLIDDLVLPAIGIRGVTGGLQSGSRLVRVMINGTAVSFRPELAAFLGPEFIPIEAVERLEIAKGPLSALYGANAFVATINVITRTPKDGLAAILSGRGTVVRGNAGGGGSALVSYRSEHLWALAALTADRIDRSGVQLQKTFESPLNPTLFDRSSGNDLATPLGAFLQLGATSPRLGTLVLAGGIQQLDSGGEFRLNSLLTGRSRVQLSNIWSNLRYEKSWSKVDFSVSLGYGHGEPGRNAEVYLTDNYSYTFKPNIGYNSATGQAEVTYTPLGKRLALRFNIDFDYANEEVLFYTQIFNRSEGLRMPGDRLDLISDTTDRQQNYYNIGAALQLASSPFRRLPNLHFVANIRVDRINFGPVSYDPLLSFRVALSYRFTQHTVAKLIAGRAFQTPSGTLLFGEGRCANTNNVSGTHILPGQSPLRPQFVDSIELLASTVLLRHFSIEGGVFSQFLSDKIEFVQTGADFVAKNRGTQTSIGLEAVARLSFGRVTGYGWGSFLWNLGNAPNPPEAYPTIFGVLGVDIDVKEAYLHINTQTRIVGPRGASQSNVTLNNNVAYELPTYAAFEFTLSTVGLHPFGRRTETRFLASVRNLIAGSRVDSGFAGFDYPNIGESYYLEVKQTF